MRKDWGIVGRTPEERFAVRHHWQNEDDRQLGGYTRITRTVLTSDGYA